ncbi:hypothetical protein NECAME_09524 [Necator americanus]|uniref:Beta-lactamase-related domain-containing protein n=1 Tax=Necator americanus TaxID=51031 RepID=W2TEA0_NECAM|nr:hypothetical protein NECAME_09524 [Necator americanus]ETN79914.1 hypothetical protein NECAME_09524 [Necator americanus]
MTFLRNSADLCNKGCRSVRGATAREILAMLPPPQGKSLVQEERTLFQRLRREDDGSKTDLEDPSNNNTEEKEFLSNVPYASVTEALTMFKDDDLIAKPGSKFSYYVRNSKHTLENCPEVDNSYKWAGGGLLSDVTDLLIFANAILYSYQASPNTKNAFLNKKIIGLLWKGEASVNDKTLAGLGWMRVNGDDFAGGLNRRKKESRKTSNSLSSLGGLWYHTGAAVGASSVLLIRPNTNRSAQGNSPSGVCVAMLCNLQDTSLLKLAKEIEDIFRE